MGAAILVPFGYQILNQGTKGDGIFAWMKIMTSRGELSIGSMYTPNERAKRVALWKWLTTNLEVENWVLCGDWNMTNLFDNAIGPNTYIHGSKMRA